MTGWGRTHILCLPALRHFQRGDLAGRGGTWRSIVSAEITYANNLDPVEVIRSDGAVEGFDPMVAALTGSMVVRFADTTLCHAGHQRQPLRAEVCLRPRGECEDSSSPPMRSTCRSRAADRGSRRGAGHLRLAGCTSREPRRLCTAVLTNTVATLLIMLRISFRTEPFWFDLPRGVRLQVRPPAPPSSWPQGPNLAARRATASDADPPAKQPPEAATDLSVAPSPDGGRLAFTCAVARAAILDWSGVVDETGADLPVSPAAIDALMEVWPVFAAFERLYVQPALLVCRRGKRLTALADWHFGGGVGLLRGLSRACADCPRVLHRPTSYEGTLFTEMIPRLESQLRVISSPEGCWSSESTFPRSSRWPARQVFRPPPSQSGFQVSRRRPSAPSTAGSGTLDAMTEKKVSVRLSAEGGRQVRAELEGIGTAGRQAFGQVTLAQKSAADSAAVFTAALDREDLAFRTCALHWTRPSRRRSAMSRRRTGDAGRAGRGGDSGGGEPRHRAGAGTSRHVRRRGGDGRAWTQRLAGPDPEHGLPAAGLRRAGAGRNRGLDRARDAVAPASRRLRCDRRGDRCRRRHRHPAPDHRHAG